jgi:3D (Asp-Asp-Asp) domain-containing protein
MAPACAKRLGGAKFSNQVNISPSNYVNIMLQYGISLRKEMLMKKIAAITMMVMSMGLFSSVMPAAHAAVIDDLLAQAISLNPSAAKVQQLINIKNDLDQGNKNAVLSAVATTLMQNAGQGDIAGAAATAISGADIRAVVQTAVQQQVEQKLGPKIAPYQDSLNALAQLLMDSKLNPQVVQNNNSLAGAPANYRKEIDMTATAYGPGTIDNGKWNNLTYMGGTVQKGVAAVDPTVIPLGTKLWIEGYGEAVATDEGSAIKGNRIDLAFNTRQEALDYGIKPVKVYLLN